MKIFVQRTLFESLMINLILEITKNEYRNNYNKGQNKMVDNVEEDR